MKKVLTSLCLAVMLCATFTLSANPTPGPKNPKVGKRSAEKFMLGFEIFRADQTPLNHTDIKIEIYDHDAQKTIFKRDYTEMPTNKYSSVTYFENMTYGSNLTMLIQAPNYFAKEINISYDEGCATEKTKFCVNGLNNPPFEIDGEYGDRFIFPVTLDSITLGEEVAIPNIYYKYNSAELQPRSFWILDSLSKVIEHNPELSIELGGHADARGQDAYNMDLSQRRVNSAKNYLTQKIGAEVAERMTAVGYGETQLINDCGNGVDCGEDLHQQNRRTTLKINEKKEETVILTLEERMKLRREKGEVAAAH